jgi:hypothetical protein
MWVDPDMSLCSGFLLFDREVARWLHTSDNYVIQHSLPLAYHQEDCHHNQAEKQVYRAMLRTGY